MSPSSIPPPSDRIAKRKERKIPHHASSADSPAPHRVASPSRRRCSPPSLSRRCRHLQRACRPTQSWASAGHPASPPCLRAAPCAGNRRLSAFAQALPHSREPAPAAPSPAGGSSSGAPSPLRPAAISFLFFVASSQVF